MIHRFVNLSFKPESKELVEQLFAEVSPKVRGFNGCEYLDIFFDPKGRGRVITYSLWDSTDHLEEYRNSELFKAFWDELKLHFAKPAEAYSLHRIHHLP